jgi:hypothetical protein
MGPDLMARHMVELHLPGSCAASRSQKTAIAIRPKRHCLGRRWSNVVNEGLSRALRLRVTNACSSGDVAKGRRARVRQSPGEWAVTSPPSLSDAFNIKR